jgi:hypothetical protein
MSFQAAATATPLVAAHYRVGLQALSKAHRALIRIADGKHLDGSINLDRALRHTKPNDPRWDYGVGIKRRADAGRAIWIEVHAASSSHVDAVLAKLTWLRGWLENEAPALDQMRARYVWLATGAVSMPANSPKRRLIAQRGLDFRAKSLDLDDLVT